MLPNGMGVPNGLAPNYPVPQPNGMAAPNGLMPNYPTQPGPGPIMPTPPVNGTGKQTGQSPPKDLPAKVTKLPDAADVKQAQHTQSSMPVLTPAQLAAMEAAGK
jgi:hypothetical protein